MTDRINEKIAGSIETLNSFQITAATAGLDKASKAALHNIEVIATILKNAVPEYKDYTKEEIMGFIDRDSFRDDMEVSPGRTNTELKSDSTEYIVLGEKTANFDYVFSARNPKLSEGKVTIKLHFDLEPQRDYRPGYPIEKRAYYYLARMLSSQLSVVTEETDYGCLEKCYGIWICRDKVPQNERYSISLYEIANTHNIGSCAPMRDNYDLMTLVVIRLGEKVYNGDEEDEGYELFDFLNLMMYPHNKDFIKNMSKYIDFSNNEELWKEATTMSGLGQSILEEGIEQGIEQGIKVLILDNLEDGKSEETIVNKLVRGFELETKEAKAYFDKYAKES